MKLHQAVSKFIIGPYLPKDLIITESYAYVIKPPVANETQCIDLNVIID